MLTDRFLIFFLTFMPHERINDKRFEARIIRRIEKQKFQNLYVYEVEGRFTVHPDIANVLAENDSTKIKWHKLVTEDTIFD